MNNQSKFKIDLHTHSIMSRDGGITKEQYLRIFSEGILDVVAITDHNEIKFAKYMQKELGEQIIIGEEITTLEGEVIGLFLSEKINSGLSAGDTVLQIKAQGGLVYIPHPFETFRSGLQENTLNKIIDYVDILEVFNARGAIRGRAKKAEAYADEKNLTRAASSDAHCGVGLGSSYSLLDQIPDRKSLIKLLQEGDLGRKYAPLISYLCPSFNKLKNIALNKK